MHHGVDNPVRLDIIHHVFQYHCDLHDADQVKLDMLRADLATILPELNRLQATVGVFHSGQSHIDHKDDVLKKWDNVFDDLDDEPIDSDLASASALPESHNLVEHQKLCLPSNGNASPAHNHIKLSLRIKQAEAHLIQLCELIAEKSSQYSNVICNAPMKGVPTKAQTTIKSINSQISIHCKVYAAC